MDNNNVTFDDMRCQWKKKRHISESVHTIWLIVAASLAGACMWTSISFMRDLGTTPDAKDTLTLFAVAIDLALFFLAIFCLSPSVGRMIRALAIVATFLVSAFSITSYFVSQQWANDNQGAINTNTYASYLASSAPDKSASLASHAAYRNRMETVLTAQRSVTSTPQTAVYAYVAKLIGVTKEQVVLLFRGFCAVTLLLAAFAIKSFRSEFFTTKELATHIRNFQQLQTLKGGQVGLNSPTINEPSTKIMSEPQVKKFHVEHPVV